VVMQGQSRTLDVLGNDDHSTGAPIHLATFDATSLNGGSISLSPGTGPGGRDELVYRAPDSYSGPDLFSYTIADGNGAESEASVSILVSDPADFRPPDLPPFTEAGLEASYYALSNPSTLPDFTTLSPYASEIVPLVNYPATSGSFAGSGRADNVGAVFEGLVQVSEPELYAFSTRSDDGSALYIGDTLVVDNDGLHGMWEHTDRIKLKVGLHRLRVEFFEAGGQAGLIASLEARGVPKQPIPATQLSHEVCRADLDGDNDTDLDDLTQMLGNYGMTAGATQSDGDVDGDGDVDLNDLVLLLTAYGYVCP